MKPLTSILALVLLLAVVVSCRMAERLTGSSQSGSINELWPDVPAFAGAKKVDLQLPFAARVVIQTMVKGKMNFIAFNTDKSSQEVKAFYSRERMNSAGWAPHDQGCVGDNKETEGHGTVCLFTRKDHGKEEGLAIVMSQPEKSGETNIIYARFDMTEASK
jgi:hypothetical protein